MATSFNAYHKWLAIPLEEQPPHHYRLLGTRLFETDPDVIESAADQRMAHLRTLQGGKNADLSQQLLNEISAAKVCLLDPDRRAEYDRQLRDRLESSPKSKGAKIRKAVPLGSAASQVARPRPTASPVPQSPAQTP